MNRPLSVYFIFLFIFISVSNRTNAQWVQSGLDGNTVQALAVSGANMFAATAQDGIFLSTDNGTSWTAVNNGLTNMCVFSLVISGSNIYAGTWGGGVFLSTDNGASWNSVSNGLPLVNPCIISMAISGSNIFAGTFYDGVYRSADNGAHWMEVNNGLPSKTPSNPIRALAISSNNIYAGTDASGVFLSTDNGANWQAINNGLGDTYIGALGIFGNNIFAGSTGTYLSTNNGSIWNLVNNGAVQFGISSMAVTEGNLFVGNNYGMVFRSTNNGSLWTQVDNGLTFNIGIFSMVFNGSAVFAGIESSGIWKREISNMDSYNLILTSFNLSGNNVVGATRNITWTALGVTNINIYYSSDDGSTWNIIASGLSASLGTYAWTIPAVSSANCRIKIEDASNHSFYDLSDNMFSIQEYDVANLTPGTGQITQSFGSTNIALSAFINISDVVTINYYLNRAPQDGTLPEGVVGISKYYWVISSPSLSFTNGIISARPSTLKGVVDATKLVWLKRSNSTDAWTNLGGIVTGDNLSSTVAFSSLSEFALGTTDGVNPLPVELSSFNASNTGGGILLQWKTENEVNNYGFEVERLNLSLKNSDKWEKLGFVQGNGNSNSLKEYSFTDNNPLSGQAQYRLKQFDNDGHFKYSDAVMITVCAPKAYKLFQNSPNPFNPSTAIRFQIPENSFVTIKVYDMIGREITTLVSEEKPAGSHIIYWNGKDAQGMTAPSGVYLYKLIAGNYVETCKMNFLK